MPRPDTTDPARRLIAEYRALPADSDRKREIIAALDGDASAQPFLVSVVADAGEYDLARIECATVLRLWPPADPGLRHRAGRALLAALLDPEEDLVRQYAAMALGPYAAHDPGVTEALAAAARSDEDPLVQACARSALKEAGSA
ncbi:HEAT repeat domain-containing protein [Streptomyces sp. NPDC001787]|uniref:HEAT repeat domain-containing protein n=1 Tax=Streptomyces sp. NPDC001787 TaxID=3154523 RepID=UPI003323400A